MEDEEILNKLRSLKKECLSLKQGIETSRLEHANKALSYAELLSSVRSFAHSCDQLALFATEFLNQYEIVPSPSF